IPKAKPVETAILAFDVFRVSHDSTATKLDTMYCDEIIWNDFHPLLNYVFFDEGSSSLNGKYRQLMPEDTKHFKVYNDQQQMETYYNMMNIVATGLKNNQNASVTVTGYVSKKELEILKNPSSVALERAENVARYLTDNWGIDKSRVTIAKGTVPKKPSNEKNPEGVEENQRVEITTTTTAILEPIMLRDTLLASDITLLRIKNTITSKSQILNWSLAGDQDGKVIFAKKGEGRPTEFIDVVLDRSTMRRLRRDENGTIDVTMMIHQQGKGEVKSKVSIPIKVRQTEMLKKRNNIAEVDRYILMLFDFGKDNLTPQNEKLVRFIQQRIEPDARIGIIGTTDRIGRLDYNIKLSQRRANSVGALFPGTIVAEGRGPDTENYNNDLPEGRFHARTVRIEVEHPRGFSSR
ncbi:MAG: OmpA family protein, partial [Candidatus Kapabacteria bacterium]|nr:OmpA family protein [Candidatus Kapabacteria bacterium]